MTNWEYVTIRVEYEKKHKDFTYEPAGRPPLVGLNAVLAAYGTDGWELVCLLPDMAHAYPALGRWELEPMAYRATFKRLAGP